MTVLHNVRRKRWFRVNALPDSYLSSVKTLVTYSTCSGQVRELSTWGQGKVAVVDKWPLMEVRRLCRVLF